MDVSKLFLLAFCCVCLKARADNAGLNFLMIGDWGGWPDHSYTTPQQKMVASAISEWATENTADFVLGLGDNFYFNGIPTDCTDPRFIHTWQDVYITDKPSLQVPWYLCAGNHDHLGNVSAQIAYSDQNEYWTYPDYNYDFTKTWTEEESGKSYSLQVVMIDTVQLVGSTGLTDENDPLYFAQPQLNTAQEKSLSTDTFAWIDQVMAESTADYLLVAGHYPVYSVCNHGPTDVLIDNLKPMLEKYGAHYLSGHDHCQEHISDNNVEYILSGNSDFCCYEAGNMDNSKIPSDSLKYLVAKRHNPEKALAGFSSFSALSSGLTVNLHKHTGEILYTLPTIPPRIPLEAA